MLTGGKRKALTKAEGKEALEFLRAAAAVTTALEAVKEPSPCLEKYINLFRDEYTKSISKGHRRSNRVDHHTTLRERLLDYLTFTFGEISYSLADTFGTYGVKNLREEALTQLSAFMDILHAILVNREYEGFSEMISVKDDNAIAEAYQKLHFDFSVRMTPSGFRSHYIKQVMNKTEVERADITPSYFYILRLLGGGDPDDPGDPGDPGDPKEEVELELDGMDLDDPVNPIKDSTLE